MSVLSLDLPEPPLGWAAYLNAKGVEVVGDDIGRASISRDAARQLFDEYRADEVRKAEHRARQEREAIEADRQFRAQLPRGLSWVDVPPGVLPVVAMTAADRAAQPKRTSVLQEALSGESMTFHRFSPAEDEQ